MIRWLIAELRWIADAWGEWQQIKPQKAKTRRKMARVEVISTDEVRPVDEDNRHVS